MLSRVIVLACLFGLPGTALAVSSIFTYQGELRENAAPANGLYDLEFSLQTSVGTPVGAPLVRESVPVSAGRFSVELDFGTSLTSDDFQLQIGVRPDVSTGTFTALTPATPIRPAPQAQVAGRADQATSVVTSSIVSASIADGSIVAADVDPTQIQRRVQASCAAGESIRAINADGSVLCNPPAIYGNGSNGNLNVTSGVHYFEGTYSGIGNSQFRSITVAAGATLLIPSGAMIKVLESVTVHGTLAVQPGAQPSAMGPGTTSPAVPVGPNYFGNAAHSGGSENAGTSTASFVQGRPGPGASAPLLTQSAPAELAIRPTYLGGGAGGNSGGTTGGGAGGGFTAIVAGGTISIAAGGKVSAVGSAGTTGAGGGGGGILVLASRTFVDNHGTLDVSGGAGGDGSSSDNFGYTYAWGAGGGGGGGIVHLIAPVMFPGTTLVAGGAAGLNYHLPITYPGALDMTSTGGGGGGGGYGRGGAGTSVIGNTSTRTYTWTGPGVAEAGEPGAQFITVADPTTLF